jgi:hypothetical protein
MQPAVSALLFTLGVVGNQLLLPSPILQHCIQSFWFIFRSFFVADADITNRVTFGRHVPVPFYSRDILLLPIISILQTLPSQNILDVAWIPLTVHLCMGYPLTIWYISVNCPFLAVYLAQRPESLLLLKSTLLWGAYKGDNKWGALLATACAHLFAAILYLLLYNTMPHYAIDFRLLGAILAQICAAEAQYQLMFHPHALCHVLSQHLVHSTRSHLSSRRWLGETLEVHRQSVLQQRHLHLSGLRRHCLRRVTSITQKLPRHSGQLRLFSSHGVIQSRW